VTTGATRLLWVDGAIRRGDEAVVSLLDRGARDGEGLFETFRVDRGVPRFWPRHMERLVLSAATLGFPVPPAPARLREGIAALLAAAGLDDAVVRITVTRGVPGGRPTRAGSWMEAEPVSARLWRGTRSGAAAAIVSRRPFEPGPLGGHKTTSRLAYHLAREEARAARADEALLATPAGHVLEGAVSNVFAVLDGTVVTPSLSQNVLPGITRAVVLERCAALGIPVRERPLGRDELRDAEVFVTGSVQEVVRIGTLDGEPLPDRGMAARLLEAYRTEALRSDA
jgi:branched-subunit amino acid aminotransferase/4-amino-4-deoxychorismate lyase